MTTHEVIPYDDRREAVRAAVKAHLDAYGIARPQDLVAVVLRVLFHYGVNSKAFTGLPYTYIREFIADNNFKQLEFVDLNTGTTYMLYVRNTLAAK